MNSLLLVSDVSETREIFQKSLGRDFLLRMVSSGREAIEAIRKGPVDIVFIDSKPVDMDGLMLLKRIKIKKDSPAAVMVNHSPQLEKRKEIFAAGAEDVLFPPLEEEVTRRLTERILEKEKLRKEVDILRRGLGEKEQWQDLIKRMFRDGEKPFRYEYSSEAGNIFRMLSRTLTRISDIEKFSHSLIEGLVEAFKLNRALLFLLDRERQEYRVKASLGLEQWVVEKLSLKPGEGLAGWLLEHNQLLRKEGITDDDISLKRQMEIIEAELAIPLFGNGKFFGLLALGNKMTGKSFSDEELEILSVAANYISIAIDNAFLYEEVSVQKKHHENILRNVPSGVITVDQEGRITTFNKMAEQILGLSAKNVGGKSIQKIGSQFADIILRTLYEERIYSHHEIKNPLDRNMRFSLSTSPLKNNSGKTCGATLVFFDITKLKDLEDRVHLLERLALWNRLATRLAQEIKNPLVAIQTFTQLLPEKYKVAAFRDKFYNVVSHEVDTLNRIVDRLIQFAQPSEIRFEETDIHKLIDETLQFLDKDISSKCIEIKKRFASVPLFAQIDKGRIEETFFNLVNNAVEAMPEGGELVIVTKLTRQVPSSEEFVEIVFQDTGCGIPVTETEKIFSPFYTTKVKGLGLGLAIAQRNVKEHGGSLGVENGRGKGVSFCLLLPQKQQGQKGSYPIPQVARYSSLTLGTGKAEPGIRGSKVQNRKPQPDTSAKPGGPRDEATSTQMVFGTNKAGGKGQSAKGQGLKNKNGNDIGN